MRVVWNTQARDDLRALTAYIALDNVTAAATVSTRILEGAELLASFPHAGRPGRVSGTRERVVSRTPYMLVYKVESSLVQILPVYHGARKWPAQF